jgi:hypothetical protein
MTPEQFKRIEVGDILISPMGSELVVMQVAKKRAHPLGKADGDQEGHHAWRQRRRRQELSQLEPETVARVQIFNSDALSALKMLDSKSVQRIQQPLNLGA